MHMSNESLLVIVLVGVIAGWLAGKLVRGAGFGLIGDLVVGVIGAFVASWLMHRLGIRLGTGMIRAIITRPLVPSFCCSCFDCSAELEAGEGDGADRRRGALRQLRRQ
jgi:uncharacterized membrane protein YeaQ/YmgE (transglycosylase-associated protein family)